MIRRALAIFLFCLLSLAGLTPSESAPLCAQVAPECCCLAASPSADDLCSDLTSVSSAPDASIQSLPVQLTVETETGVSTETNSVSEQTLEKLSQLQESLDPLSSSPQVAQDGHEDCCCAPVSTPDTPDSALSVIDPLPDFAECDVRVLQRQQFPFHDYFSESVPDHQTRPLHLATNKVYLLKRCLLI